MAIRVNPLLLSGTASGSSTGPLYPLAKSFRVRGSSAVTTWRQFPTAGNRQKWTWSGWVKRGSLGTYQVIFGAHDNLNHNDSTYQTIAFGANDQIGVSVFSTWHRLSTRVFRDKHAWMHVVVAQDTTLADAQSRYRIWVNGDEITSWTTNATITQNTTLGINGAVYHGLGRVNYDAAPGQGDMLIANVQFIDGQALTPASFGQLDPRFNQWVPKEYTGTFTGTSFWLDFNTDWTSGSSISSYYISDYTAVGSYTWTVPSNFYDAYAQIWGGGAGGGAGADSGGWSGNNGGYSQFNGAVAYGGNVGAPGYGSEGAGGTGGSASGGQTNMPGNAGSTSSGYSGGAGGAGAQGGGAGGTSPGAGSPGNNGQLYGGGGSGGGGFLNAQGGGGGGGGGAFVGVTYTLANVSPGQNLTLIVGGGGSGDGGTYPGGAGAQGRVYLQYRLQTGGVFYKGMGDRSGLGNHWTPNPNFRTDGVYNDLLTDSPTDNVPPVSGSAGGYSDFWAGTVGYNSNASWGTTSVPVAIPRGKWFVEGYVLALSGTYYAGLGMRPAGNVTGVEYVGDRTNSMGVIAGGTALTAYQNNVQGGAITRDFTGGAAMAMAVDTIAGKAWIGGGNNAGGYSWIGGGNPETGTNPTYTFATELEYYFALSMYNNTTHWNVGHVGSWTTLKPASFKWFRASNFDTPLIPKSSDAFDVDLWAGSGALRGIPTPFDAHTVWVKQRNASQINIVVDQDRGDLKTLVTDSPGNEGTNDNTIYLANASLGYELGSSAFVNGVGNNYVGWAFRKGPAYGFDVQGYAGDGVGVRNIAHNLGAVPEMYWVKRRDLDGSWRVYHKGGSATPHTGCAFLEGNQAYTTTSIWGNQAPSPTTISVGTDPDVNASGGLYIVYLWRGIPGFSKFGKYVGNGRSDEGSLFLPLGFKPRWLMIKRVDGAGGWSIYDSERSRTNPVGALLLADVPDAEYTNLAGYTHDFVSNGVKLRATVGDNNSGATYIYAAFAEAPYQFATAR